jgi:hypothetical protein
MTATSVPVDAEAAERRYMRRAARLQRLAAVLAVAGVLEAAGLFVISGLAIYRFSINVAALVGAAVRPGR